MRAYDGGIQCNRGEGQSGVVPQGTRHALEGRKGASTLLEEFDAVPGWGTYTISLRSVTARAVKWMSWLCDLA